MDFFLVAKVGSFLIAPLNVIFLALAVATVLLWLGRWHSGRALVTLVAGVLVLLILVPVGSLLLGPLEQRFPIPSPLPTEVHGIVLLGGAQQPQLSKAYGQAALNERAERMTTFLTLARRYRSAKLIASGGSADPLRRSGTTEAETTRMFLEEQGFDAGRVLFEENSRNTYENGVFSKELAKPMAGETWLLITSAADIPRAVGVFRKLGWPVTPVPCDYNALPVWSPNLALLGHLRLLHAAAHEWLGLAAYYLTGRTNAFFPHP